MKAIMTSNICIVMLLLIAASCIARSVKNQIKLKDRFNPLALRKQADNVSCNWAVSFLQFCPHSVEGVLFYFAPLANDCGAVLINMTMNVTNASDVGYYSHHFIGNIVAGCSPDDKIVGNISGRAYFSDGEYNMTANICSDQCDNYSIEGEYEYIPVAECYEVYLNGGVC